MTAKPRFSLLAVGLVLAFSMMCSPSTTAQDMPSTKVNADPTSYLPGESYYNNSDGGITYGCTTCHSPWFPDGFDYVSDVTIYFATGHANTLSKIRGGLQPTIYPTASDYYGSGASSTGLVQTSRWVRALRR